MASLEDDSYLITGKVCPPRLPMQNIPADGWNTLTPALLESLFTKTSVPGIQTSTLNSLCALSFQASVWLSTDGLSSSSVVGLPYFFCNFCDFHTDSKAQLLRHIACKHVLKCKLCDFISVTRYELVQHQLHKHLDAEEMQPILSSKMIHLNLSLLQRSLQNLTQHDSNFHNSTSSSSKRDESELVNSSQMNTPQIFQDGQQDAILQELNDRSKCHQAKIKNLSAVTSSKCTLQNSCANISVKGESLSVPDWQTLTDSNEKGNLTKRSCSDVEIDDCELSLKRLKKHCDDQVHDVYVSSQRPSSHMPHFLDESDSNVTSSCSPYKNTSPVMFESRKTEQISCKNTQIRSHDTNHAGRVLSFLMEPIGTTADIESARSDINCDDYSTSKPDSVQKILHWYNDQGDSNVCKESEKGSPSVSQVLPEYSKCDSCTSFEDSKEIDFCERQKSHNPDLSSLSKEKLQLEKPSSKVSGGSFVGSLRDMLKVSQLSSGKLLSKGSLSKSSDLSISLGPSGKMEHGVGDRSYESKHLEPQYVNSQNLANFLAVPENAAVTVQVKNREGHSKIIQNENGCKKNDTRSAQQQSSAYEGEKFDLLRKLLVGTAGISKQTETVSDSTTEIYEKQFENSTSKNFPHFGSFHVNKERCEFKGHAPSVTRASDMSLKDLLTQGLENIPSSVFCSYCNFKSPSKAEIQNHTEKCKRRRGSEKSETQSHIYGLSRQIVPEPGCVSDKISTGKNVPTSVLGSSLDDSYSKKFMASEVLRGLSEHYSESLSSDISLTSESDIQMSQTNSFLSNQAQCLNKTVHTSYECKDVNGRHLRHRTSRRKKPEFDNYEFSNSSSSCNSDSDDKQCSVSNVMKKRNEKKLKNKEDFAQNKKSGSNGVAVPQIFDEEILHNCLHCDFSTCSIANMQHHLIGNHFERTPFAEALIQPQGKTMIYFCRGAQFGCTFFSGDGSEIFEHIKLCYYGFLDNFINNNSETEPDYSQVLLSLGEVSRFTDQPAVSFHCLRCRYSRPDYQNVAGHVADNHAHNVAGVMSINTIFKEPKVGMVCLTCNAHISVKQWAFHSCRKRSGECSYSRRAVTDLSSMVASTSTSNMKTHFRMLGNSNCQPGGEEDEQVLNRYRLNADSHKNGHDVEVDCKPEIMRLNDSVLGHASDETDSHISRKPFSESNFSEFVNVKQEISDVNFTDGEFVDYVEEFLGGDPVHVGQTKADSGRAGRFKDCETVSNRFDQQVRTTISPQICSRRISPGPSVLQTLLTAPKDAELTPKGFSMLHKLLKSDPTAKNKRQSKQLSVLPVEASYGPLNTHSQYPCILGMLSRQGCSTHETSCTDSVSISPRAGRLQKDIGEDHSTNSCSPVLMNESSLVSSQQSQDTGVTKCLPNMPVSVTDILSSVSVSELSPPIIPHPPMLPLLPPLSPSPPQPSTAALTISESQDTPGPFTNLLRLLSKSKMKSGSAQEPTI